MSASAELPAEPIVVGATINRAPSPPRATLCPAPPSPLILSPAATSQSLNETATEFDPHLGAKPHSPFYRHNVADASMEQLKQEMTVSGKSFGSQDLESGPSQTPPKRSVDIHHMRASKLWAEKKKRFDCMSSLSKKQRLAIKLLIALIIVGTMVGVALGITAAVHGGVWKSNNQYGTLG